MRPELPNDDPSESAWACLAAMRFLLALIVLCHHLTVYPSITGVTSPIVFLSNLNSFVAILCFLVISGYSIAHSSLKKPDGFYRRRFARIYPLYFFSIVIPLLIERCKKDIPLDQLFTPVGNLFFLQTFTVKQTTLNPVVWTLAIEVACYVLTPFFNGCTTRFLLILGCTSAAIFIWYQLTFASYPAFLGGGQPFVILLWAWLAGFLYYRRKSWSPSLLVLLLFISGMTYLNRMSVEPLYLLSVASLILSFWFGKWLKLPVPVERAMLYCGDISYPLYIFHYPLVALVTVYFSLAAWQMLLICLLLAALGVAFEQYLRRPANFLFDGVAGILKNSTSLRHLVK